MFLVLNPCPISGKEGNNDYRCIVCDQKGFHASVFDPRRSRCMEHCIDSDKIEQWKTNASIPDKQIPSDRWQLLAMKSIHLEFEDASAPIKSVSAEVAYLPNLESIRISGQAISNFPDAFRHINRLKDIRLNSLNLDDIPDFVFSSPELESLSLMNNCISTIPDKLWQLKKLKRLNLGWNRISILPEGIQQLTALESLYLWDNQLSDLPQALCGMPHLQVLHIQGNKIHPDDPMINTLKGKIKEVIIDNNWRPA